MFNVTMPRPKTMMRVSVGVALTTIVLKIIAWRITNSVSLLSDWLEALVNLAGALFGLTMVSISERPADVEHPHGHHKAEYFSSGFEGALIMGAALVTFWSAAERLLYPQPLQQLGWGLWLSAVSALFNALLSWSLLKAAKTYKSIALEADGKHIRADVYTSIGVIVGLLLAIATGWNWVDSLIAIAVAINILREGWGLLYQSSQGLMDSSASPEVNKAVQNVLSEYTDSYAQKQIDIHFNHVLTRAAGRRNYATMHLHLPSDWSLEQAADLRNKVEISLMNEVPSLHVTIELMPSGLEPHRVLLNAPLYGLQE